MNTLRRVGLVVISCIILLLSLLCPVSAASFIQEDDLLINDDLMLMPNGTLSNGNVATTDLASSPNYPQFNPNMIPWKDAPDYVKEVLLSNINDINKSGNPKYFSEPAKVPFVCVRVNGSNVIVYVGYNLTVLYLESSGNPVLGRLVFSGYNPNDSTDVNMLSSTLYRAEFNLSDMSVNTPWYDASNSLTRIDSQLGDLGYVYTYTSALTTTTRKFDLYFFGANYVFWNPPDAHTGVFAFGPLGPNDSNNVYYTLNLSLGFKSGSNFFYNESNFVNTYCQYFVPKTMPDVNTGVVGDHSAAEDALVNGYNPDNLSGDINIEVDASAWQAIFSIFDLFISDNAVLVHLIVTMLSLGFIALLLNR